MAYGITVENVKTVQNGIQSGYNLIMNELNNSIQTKFIDVMAVSWACPIAQEYFANTVQPQLETIIGVTNDNFNNFQNSVKSVAEGWMRAQGEEGYTAESLDVKLSTISIAEIKEILNGKVGIIDVEKINSAVSSLSTIATTIQGYLEQVEMIINNNEMFEGGGQQEALLGYVKQVSNATSEGFAEIKSGLTTAMNNTIEAYQTKATNIAGSFTASTQ